MIVLNLGCGTKTSDRCVNLDWARHLRIARGRFLKLLARAILSRAEFQRFATVSKSIVCHNLKHGIPYPNGSVDAVYHSHVLEHIDRVDVEAFLREIFRVLKPGGIHRICVPDLAVIVERYRESLNIYDRTSGEGDHDKKIAAIIEQSVRRESAGSAQRPPFRRWIENLIMGDARKRGETHQWMYDRCNILEPLTRVGFVNIATRQFNQSEIPDWKEFGLEVDAAGGEYKPLSLYVECKAPTA